MSRLSSRLPLYCFAVIVMSVIATGSVQAERKEIRTSSELPPEIKAAVDKDYPNAKFLLIEQEVEGDDPGQYDIELRSGGKEYEMEIAPDGTIIEAAIMTQASKTGSSAPADATDSVSTLSRYRFPIAMVIFVAVAILLLKRRRTGVNIQN